MGYTKEEKRAYILRLKQEEALKKKKPKKEPTSKLTESNE